MTEDEYRARYNEIEQRYYKNAQSIPHDLGRGMRYYYLAPYLRALALGAIQREFERECDELDLQWAQAQGFSLEDLQRHALSVHPQERTQSSSAP